MAKPKLIKRSEKVLTADFPDGKVVFNIDTHRPYMLNESASAIWDFCKSARDIGSIVKYLHKRYGVSAGRAERDVRKFVAVMRRAGIMR